MLQGQTAVSEPFRARSKTSCAGDIGGDGTVSDARRAVSRRLQALRATAAPHRSVHHVIFNYIPAYRAYIASCSSVPLAAGSAACRIQSGAADP